ncbi:peptidoglycan-binding protein [Stappia stellulata]|uniref:peptidoglycan-binding domain-containing protein n=1 Tax=Stappia stellulata TaxID=71235 RepID=UPI001CD63ECC|nr:peptidoglycan-binding protein [Stappia stellulata]MCA1244606.1 peptidoglycan-binding protein [Stappia stellulata]
MSEGRRKTRAPQVRTRAAEQDTSSSGGGLGAAALDNPVAAGGWLVMVLTGFLIIANATAFQSGRHPAPLVATRDRASPPAQAAPATPDRATLQAQKLVRDIQVELRRLGMYEGPLDGLKGPATERGVRAYQRARGLAETGRVNEALMARLALDTGDGVNGPDAPPLPPVPPASVPGASSAPPSVTPSAAPSAALSPERARIVGIQSALAELGYGPIEIDGYAGEQTSNAIRRFELDRGLPINGAITERIATELENVLGRPLAR